MIIYKVGGFVRDSLLGLNPKDIDYVVVNSTTEEMLSLGYEQVGADFPVFLHPETKDEYALARKERKTGNGYNGFSVDINNVSLEEDLFRRDLTVNAMAFNQNNDLIDPFNGLQDLKNKTLRHVSQHFKEDPVRILRVARFAARYNFNVADETLEFMKEMVNNGEFNKLTKERVWKEFEKAFQEPHLDKFFDILNTIGALDKLDSDFKNIDLSFIKSIQSDNNKYDLKFWIIFSQLKEENLEKWGIPTDLKKNIQQFRININHPLFYSSMKPESKLKFINHNKLIHDLSSKKDLFDGIIEHWNFYCLYQKDMQTEFEILKSDIDILKKINYQELIKSCEKGTNIKDFINNIQISTLTPKKKFII